MGDGDDECHCPFSKYKAHRKKKCTYQKAVRTVKSKPFRDMNGALISSTGKGIGEHAKEGVSVLIGDDPNIRRGIYEGGRILENEFAPGKVSSPKQPPNVDPLLNLTVKVVAGIWDYMTRPETDDERQAREDKERDKHLALQEKEEKIRFAQLQEKENLLAREQALCEATEVFEHQRALFGSWSADYLSTYLGDTYRYSDQDGCIDYPFSKTAWIVDKTIDGADEKGWSYGITFTNIRYNYKNGCNSPTMFGSCVRRRRWIRKEMPPDKTAQISSSTVVISNETIVECTTPAPAGHVAISNETSIEGFADVFAAPVLDCDASAANPQWCSSNHTAFSSVYAGAVEKDVDHAADIAAKCEEAKRTTPEAKINPPRRLVNYHDDENEFNNPAIKKHAAGMNKYGNISTKKAKIKKTRKEAKKREIGNHAWLQTVVIATTAAVAVGIMVFIRQNKRS